MDPTGVATLVADEFAWGDRDLAISPHERVEGIIAKSGFDMAAYKKYGSGSKRTKLRWAIKEAQPDVRLRIVQAVLKELPERKGEPEARSAARTQLVAWVASQSGIAVPVLGSALVNQALQEYETLLREHGPGRAFDRLHSGFSAYLRDLHRQFLGDSGTKPLHKLLESVGGALTGKQDPDGMARRILQAIKSVANDLDTLRNKPAHGELQKENADLARDFVASVFRFLHARLGDGKPA